MHGLHVVFEKPACLKDIDVDVSIILIKCRFFTFF